MKIRILNYPIFLVMLLVGLLAASCHDDPETPTLSEGRTVLVYQVANNNLNGYSYDDFKEMMDGASRGLGKGNRLIVYRHTRYEGPSLVEITAKDTVTLKHYDKSLSSVDINRMTEVINDVKRLANTPQYGLVLWSHASGWIEDGIEQSPVKRSFGDDNYKRMNNRDLARALKASGGFDWIYFDCCYIGIAPFAAHGGKIYPPELMEQVLARLQADADAGRHMRIFLFGGGAHEQEVLERWAGKYPCATSLAGKRYGFPAELALFNHLDAVVSMDSANMHLAAIAGAPTISIWGATHPYCGFRGWRQSDDDTIQLPIECRPCSVFGDKPCYRGDHLCMNAIKPDLIYSRLMKKIGAGA